MSDRPDLETVRTAGEVAQVERVRADILHLGETEAMQFTHLAA